MPSPKDGTECPLASPVAPKKALDADDAKHGSPAQRADPTYEPGKRSANAPVLVDGGGGNASGSGAGGGEDSSSSPPDVVDPTAWVSFSLKDDKGKPVPNEPYLVKTADGQEITGTLDENGKAKLSNVKPGSCQISFPRIDKNELKKV